MNATKKERLEFAGVDIESMMERFMGNDSMMERFLGKFLEDSNYDRLLEAVEAGNVEGAITASHTLKGICGNLSMNILYSLFTRQVEALRADKWEEAVSLMPEIQKQYSNVTDAIRECASM